MRSAALAVLVVVLAGCGGSSGGTDSSSDFRTAVHAAYDAVPSEVADTPTAHPAQAVKAWGAFRDKVAAMSAPDPLVAAKAQLLRDVGLLLTHVQATAGALDYEDISAAQEQTDEDLAAIEGDVAGL